MQVPLATATAIPTATPVGQSENVFAQATVTQQQPQNVIPQEEKLTSEQKWGLVYSAAMLYNGFDATLSFLLAFLGLIVLLVARASNEECEILTFVPPIIVFVLRIIDLCFACTDLCCSCFGSRGPPTHKEFAKIVLRNLLLTVTIGLLAIVQLILGGIAVAEAFGAESDSTRGADTCTFPGIGGVVFGCVLLCNAIEEAFVWGYCYVFTKIAETQEVPEWVDKYIPSCLKHYATKRNYR